MLDEAMLLPPIDLTLSGEALESTSVLVMIPVPRGRLRTLQATLTSISRTLPAAAPNAITRSHPLDVLRLRLPPRIPIVPLPNPEELAEQAWREALARFVREHTGGRSIEQMKLPLGIVATDLDSGEPILFQRGDLALFDRYYAGWFMLALLQEMGVEFVTLLHQLREADFNQPSNPRRIALLLEKVKRLQSVRREGQ